jgi:hypothetical protein
VICLPRLLRVAAIIMVLTAFPAPALVSARPVTTTPTTVAGLLAMLDVRPESTSPRYQRSLFRHWVDADRDCQDTRTEVLVREDLRAASHGCRVRSGAWVSWLDGRRTTTAGSFDVDHLVPLAEAWSSGAHAWSARQREAFANDLGYKWSLRAVSASSNRSKSDRDPAEWLPSAAVRCDYAGRWMAVKYRWSLTVDPQEHAALTDVVAGECAERSITLPARVQGLGVHPDPQPTGGATSPPSPGVSSPAGAVVSEPVRPGAFCKVSGAIGRSSKDVVYECRSTIDDPRLRWRR